MNEDKFTPEDFGFEDHYETGIECPTWIYSEDDGYEHWKYILSQPYNTWNSEDDNPDIWTIQVVAEDNEHASRGKVYEGLIPSRNYAEVLFVNLKLYYLQHVRRELNLDSLLNK